MWWALTKRGQLERVFYEELCAPGDELCEQSKTKSVEYYVHDIFGRRIAKIEASDPYDGEPPPAAIMYDYDGLSHTLLAERHATKGAFVCDDNMIATYTQGPFGAITRTDERFDYDLSNNKDAYYLSDALGQNVAMVTRNGGVPSLADPGMRSQVHDAFGVLIATIPAAGTWGGGGPDIDEGDCRYAGDSEATVAGEDGYAEAGPYRWRGWEASKTDRMPGPLEDDLKLGLRHRRANLPMHDVPAATVQEAAKIVKCATNIDVRNVNMPMLMRPKRLHEAGALA